MLHSPDLPLFLRWGYTQILEKLHPAGVNILLQLPGALLIGQSTPLDQVVGHLVSCHRVFGGDHVQHAIHLHIVGVEILLVFWLSTVSSETVDREKLHTLL